jgi:hypothetical protein
VMIHACNPSTQEAEAGGLRVWGWHGLLSNTVFILKKKKGSKKEKRKRGGKEGINSSTHSKCQKWGARWPRS